MVVSRHTGGVRACGNVPGARADHRIRIREIDGALGIDRFAQYDLGNIGLEQKTLRPLDNRFGARLSPVS